MGKTAVMVGREFMDKPKRQPVIVTDYTVPGLNFLSTDCLLSSPGLKCEGSCLSNPQRVYLQGNSHHGPKRLGRFGLEWVPTTARVMTKRRNLDKNSESSRST